MGAEDILFGTKGVGEAVTGIFVSGSSSFVAETKRNKRIINNEERTI